MLVRAVRGSWSSAPFRSRNPSGRPPLATTSPFTPAAVAAPDSRPPVALSLSVGRATLPDADHDGRLARRRPERRGGQRAVARALATAPRAGGSNTRGPVSGTGHERRSRRLNESVLFAGVSSWLGGHVQAAV